MRIGGEAADALIAFMLLWPAGFVFSEASQRLPPLLRSPLFGPHVATYLAAYVVIAKAAVQAAARLLRGDAPPEPGLIGRDAACWRLARLAFPLLTAGLILGAWWGRLAWADFWHWDPKELWSLATWLVFAAYLHLRATFGARFGRANAWLVMAGTGCAAATLLWANLARLFAGLHSYAA
jgi:ABC-type transport system involved in cytochrome c biogenesis permease subunit